MPHARVVPSIPAVPPSRLAPAASAPLFSLPRSILSYLSRSFTAIRCGGPRRPGVELYISNVATAWRQPPTDAERNRQGTPPEATLDRRTKLPRKVAGRDGRGAEAAVHAETAAGGRDCGAILHQARPVRWCAAPYDCNGRIPQPTQPSDQDMRRMRSTVHMAEEMGKRLGGDHNLQQAVQERA